MKPIISLVDRYVRNCQGLFCKTNNSLFGEGIRRALTLMKNEEMLNYQSEIMNSLHDLYLKEYSKLQYI